MGLFDTVSSARPFGVSTEPREDYKPPRVVRRLDIPEPQETLRDLLLKTLSEKPCSWSELCSMVQPRGGSQGISDITTQLVREGIVVINAKGEFVFVPVNKRNRTVSHITFSDKTEKSGDTLGHEQDFKSLLLLIAHRALDTEDRYKRMIEDTQAELLSEREARRVLQSKVIRSLEGFFFYVHCAIRLPF